MANGKNKIIFYKDWQSSFEDLTDEEAGILIKHFFKYVNDENPILEDRVIRAHWIHIENTLKRDLKKWEETIEKRSEAGKASAIARKEQKATKSTSVKSVQHNSTKSTVIVNDSVIVKDKVIVNDINKTIPSFASFVEYATLKSLETDIDVDFTKLKLKYESWIENDWCTSGKKSRKIKNWKTTLLNTLIYLKKEKDSDQKEKPKMLADVLKKREGIPKDAKIL